MNTSTECYLCNSPIIIDFDIVEPRYEKVFVLCDPCHSTFDSITGD